MKQYLLSITTIFILLGCQKVNHPPEKLEFQNLFGSGMNSKTACYRIPSLIKTGSGTLIAAIDERNDTCGDLRSNKDINIVIRTSNDDGKTWSEITTAVDYPFGESASDPSMIFDKETNEVFLFFNYMNHKQSSDEYFLRFVSSRDDGLSWSSPKDITNQISKEGWQTDFKFITSGRGIQTANGMLLHTLVNLDQGLHVFGSSDHGKSWFLLDSPIHPGDESKIIELGNGDWMINSRVNRSGFRHVHLSNDKGLTWHSSVDSSLVDPACNASLIRYTSIKDGFTKDRLLFSNLDSDSSRANLSLRISYDEGRTWKHIKSIYTGSAAYSSLSILENGDIGIFFEMDNYEKNVFTRVTLEWLTDGDDSIKKKKGL